jgi:hypothetical protein
MTITSLVQALALPISPVRLEAYRPDGGSDLEMIANYVWNIELSEALYPSLQAFEVALRNSVHRALSERFQTEFWFDQGVLLAWQAETLQQARDQLTTYGKPHEPGRIVAELSFGFWSSMFNSPYEAMWYANAANLLDVVFPNLPRTMRTRKKISRRIERIRRLRNRVFHYEPIWNKTDLQQRHHQIDETLAWISTDMRDVMALSDRFASVYAGKQGIEARLMDYLANR